MGEKVNKEKEETMMKSNKTSLVFAINGERFELDLSSIDPSATLIEFLRNKTPFKSVKLGCGEGGCGACVVLLSKYDPLLDKVDDFTISSCLTLLCSIDGCSITTSEGLGNSRVGFHAVHERIAGFHATQCGFCTPGMSVSMFSALLNADKSLPPPKGCSNLTAAEAEKAVAGNLCRCTGYRPLVDACKSFSADVDIEDLGFNSFCKKGDNREEVLGRLPCYDHASSQVCTFPEFLKDEIKIDMNLDSRKYRWSSPVSVSELQGLLEVENSMSVKLVAGNTSTGYYKEEKGRKYERFIDIRRIPELTMVRKDEKGVELGAAVTISKAIEALRDKENGSMLAKLATHMEKIANRFVRNTGTIGGNIMMAQRKQFPSDLTTILVAARATVKIMTSSSVQEQFTLEEFLQHPPLDTKSVLLSLEIPSWIPVKKNGSSSDSRLLFETYRAAPRPLGNALPFMNAAFSAEVSLSDSLDGVVVYDCRLAFGAYGTKHAHRARKAEEFLAGKVITDEVLMEAIGLLKDEIVPHKGTSNPSYRSSLAVTFLFEFFGSLTQTKAKTTNGWLNGGCKENGFHQNGESLKPEAMLSSAQQIVENEEHTPVGKGIVKAGACLQASGEAVYVDDIPSPENCLYGALIYSTMPLARIKSIRFKENRVPEGVLGIITYKDIPKGGKNIGSTGFFSPDMLFAEEITHGAGQMIAFLVADSQKRADIAANHVVIDYDTTGLEPPILSLEEAVEKSSLYEVPVFLRSKPVGDITKGLAEAEHKILGSKISLGSQYFFYMETQTALAVPDEDNCMVVYSSTQAPEFVHRTIAGCLGVPEHNVRVITRRLGGGFGGKVIKAQPVAAACALAAYKMQRPVRIYVNRKTDMITTGGRHPMKITYSVGFKPNGKITALDIEVLLDAGLSEDVSPLMPSGIQGALMKYDWGAFSCDIKVCKTNRVSRTAVRAPGDVQGSYIAEAIIEKVASYLSVDVDEIRKVNLHTYESLRLFYNAKAGDSPEYTLPLIWDKLAEFSGFNQRRVVVDEFNASNKWRKRGIARVPAIYGVSGRATPGRVSVLSDGSIAVEVQGIEMGQGLWTKVKQMAAFSLGLIQCGTTSDELLQKIRVIQSDTLSMVQGSVTGGSTSSEMSSEAVRMCCNGLVERLLPVKNTLVEQTGGPVTWDKLISQAYLQAINMSVSTSYLPDFATGQYLNYGVAASEVEVNILTGETTILRSDIIYDCGKSLNPAVDLGQIEGAFVQGVGFFMLEEFLMNSDGLVVTDSTWTYKIPTVDTIPRQFNVEILNSGQHKDRVLSSKASGEPPLLLASSVHCAVRAAVKEAKTQMLRWSNNQQGADLTFELPVPATMPVVKESCGLDVVEKYLEWKFQQRKNI